MAKPKKCSITWFGELSYNKLKVPDLEAEAELCPVCSQPLVKLAYVGNNDPPSKVGEYWLNPDDWQERLGYSINGAGEYVFTD